MSTILPLDIAAVLDGVVALMKQLSIAQCSGNPTYWNTSYDKKKYSWYWITKLPYT
jgi:hypothetical protein